MSSFVLFLVLVIVLLVSFVVRSDRVRRSGLSEKRPAIRCFGSLQAGLRLYSVDFAGETLLLAANGREVSVLSRASAKQLLDGVAGE